MNFSVEPRLVLFFLLGLIFSLLVANLFGMLSEFYFGHDYVYGLVHLFHFDMEKNIPTLYSTSVLLFCSILLFTIAMGQRKKGLDSLAWFGLAVIFLFLSIDEMSEIHENLTKRHDWIIDNPTGIFYFAWIIPYGVAVLVFVLIYARFLLRLPRKIALLFIISGATYVSRAIGFEMIGATHAEEFGQADLKYSIFTTCEELVEMLGIALFVYALLTYIVEVHGKLTVVVGK